MPNLKLDDDQKSTIGSKVGDYVSAGLQAKGRLPQWWEQVQRIHRNEGGSGADQWGSYPEDPGYAQFHIPFSQPRQDMLVAQVCTVVNKQDPYMLATRCPDDLGTNMQHFGHYLWQDAGFEQAIRHAATYCSDTDMAIIRHTPQERNGRPAVGFDVIAPEDFVCFPSFPEGPKASAFCGHRIYRRQGEIEDKIEAKVYYDGTVSGGDNPQDTDTSGTIRHAGDEPGNAGPDTRDLLVECWDGLIRYDLGKGEKWYHCVIALNARTLLQFEDYDYDDCWYFVGHFVGDPKQFWSGSSVGRNLYPLQSAVDRVNSGAYAGLMTGVMPPMVGPKLESGEKFTTYKWASYIESDEPVQPWSPNIRPDLSFVMPMLEYYAQVGDQVARISQNTQGSQATGDTTATEQSIIAAGVAVGVEEYIANFTEDFGRMMRFTFQIVAKQYNEFVQAYGDENPPDVPGQPDENEPMLGVA